MSEGLHLNSQYAAAANKSQDNPVILQNSAPLGPQTDEAAGSLLDGDGVVGLQEHGSVLTDTNLPEAMDLPMGIAAEAPRGSAISRFYHAWRKTGPDSALEWHHAQWPTLPESTRQRPTNEEIRTVTVH